MATNISFAEIPVRLPAENTFSKITSAPAAVIKTSNLTIAISNEISDSLLSRLIMNYQLMLHNYPPVSIPVADKLHYYECLQAYAVTGDIEPFADILGSLVSQRLDEYFEIIQPMDMNLSDFEQRMI
ncbi:MAG: hypothetical protein RR146_09970 [Lachnospiraceae bacterium]